MSICDSSLTLENQILFTKHNTEKNCRAHKSIGIIRYLSYVPLNTLGQLYKMYVRLQLDYCYVRFHIPQISNPFVSFWMFLMFLFDDKIIFVFFANNCCSILRSIILKRSIYINFLLIYWISIGPKANLV